MIKEFQNIAIMAKERNITFTQLLDYISLFSKYTPQNKGDILRLAEQGRSSSRGCIINHFGCTVYS